MARSPFVGTNPENAANFCIVRHTPGITRLGRTFVSSVTQIIA